MMRLRIEQRTNRQTTILESYFAQRNSLEILIQKCLGMLSLLIFATIYRYYHDLNLFYSNYRFIGITLAIILSRFCIYETRMHTQLTVC